MKSVLQTLHNMRRIEMGMCVEKKNKKLNVMEGEPKELV